MWMPKPEGKPMAGRSNAVRLPAGMRLGAAEVRVPENRVAAGEGRQPLALRLAHLDDLAAGRRQVAGRAILGVEETVVTQEGGADVLDGYGNSRQCGSWSVPAGGPTPRSPISSTGGWCGRSSATSWSAVGSPRIATTVMEAIRTAAGSEACASCPGPVAVPRRRSPRASAPARTRRGDPGSSATETVAEARTGMLPRRVG